MQATAEQRARWQAVGEELGDRFRIVISGGAKVFCGVTGAARLSEAGREFSPSELGAVDAQVRQAHDDFVARHARQTPERQVVDPTSPDVLSEIGGEANRAADEAGRFRDSDAGRSERTIELLESILGELQLARRTARP